MDAVSNQQFYQPLEPLPVPEEHYRELTKVISQLALSVLVTGFAAVFGLGLGLAEIGLSIEAGLIGGGAAGALASLFFCYLVSIPSKICQYRIDTLSRVYGQLRKDRRTEDKIEGLKKFLTYPLDRFGQTYQNHMLHNALTCVGDSVAQSERADIKKVWKAFLEHLDHTKVVNADGETIELDFSTELARLDGVKMEFQLEGVNLKNSADLEQIEALQKLSFGKTYTVSKEQLKAELSQNGSGCVIARKKGSKDILGFGWYHGDAAKVNISGIAVLPGATGLAIGDQLVHAILTKLSSKRPEVELQVRKSNPARTLYENWGFEVQKELPNYCTQDPPEDSLLMALKWEKFDSITRS